MSRFAITKKLSCGFEEAIGKARKALEKEGFEILSGIDASDRIKKRVGKAIKKFLIIGAWDPPLAYKALTVEPESGLLLPYNLIIHENDDGGCTVAVIDPVVPISIIDNPALSLVAREVRDKMEKVMDNITDLAE